jgi:hypothetical protein
MQQNSQQMKLKMIERSFKQIKNLSKFLEIFVRQKTEIFGVFEGLNNPSLGSF